MGIHQNFLEEKIDIKKISKLNLVDLAGSERTRITGAKGKQLEESKKINKSLSCLGNVINALTELKGNINHIPYSDSKLTRLLEDSLGGNCFTTLITMISPCQNYISETLSSLSFARRAKRIKNRPVKNEQIKYQNLIKQYEIQLKNLRNELDRKDEMIKNNSLIKQINQLNEDKNNMMKQLEESDQKYLKEKNTKKELEKQIQEIKKNLEENTKDNLNENNNQNIKNNKLSNNNNAEIERYKNLILKQREMMSELTKKINEKDENIIQLQEEKELLEKINEQGEYYISLLNKNFNNLIEYCKNIKGKKNSEDNDEILNNCINLNKKINSDILNKYESKEKEKEKEKILSSNKKKYLPYNYSLENNKSNNLNNISSLNSSMTSNIYNNNLNNLNNEIQIALLTPEEKIKELKNILKEKENVIKILKIFSQKFLSNYCESNEGKINLEQIKHDFKNGFELYSKMKEIEENKNLLKKENEQLKEKIIEFQNNIFKIHNILDDIKLNNINNINNINNVDIINNNNNNINNIKTKIDEINIIVSQLININIDNLIKENNNNDSIIEKNKNEFNQKIQKIIKENNENLAKIENSINNEQLIKKNYKKNGEKKFVNKFINIDK